MIFIILDKVLTFVDITGKAYSYFLNIKVFRKYTYILALQFPSTTMFKVVDNR